MLSFLVHSCNMPTDRGVDFIKIAGSISYIYLSLPFLPNTYVTSSIQVSPKILPFPVFLRFEYFSFPGGSKIKTVKKKAKETAQISELYIRMRITKYFMFRFTLFR